MSLKIVHISDTHAMHDKFIIPECDLLIHSGDIGTKTNLEELLSFLVWFEKQPADCKIFIAGNHDIILDKKEAQKEKDKGNVYGWGRLLDGYKAAMDLIENYDVKYLNGKDYVYKGLKIYGSPYSPSFHREHWAFNADRGNEIRKEWSKIPSDVDILVTHSGVQGVLDLADEGNVGCADLFKVIKARLFQLKIHCFGHIHQNYGVVSVPISNSRYMIFSNGAMLTHQYKQLATSPFTINL